MGAQSKGFKLTQLLRNENFRILEYSTKDLVFQVSRTQKGVVLGIDRPQGKGRAKRTDRSAFFVPMGCFSGFCHHRQNQPRTNSRLHAVLLAVLDQSSWELNTHFQSQKDKIHHPTCDTKLFPSVC